MTTTENKKRSRAIPQPRLVAPFDRFPVDVVRRMVQFLPLKQRVLATAHIFAFDVTKGWAFAPDQVFDTSATALFADVAELQTTAVRSESVLKSLTLDNVLPFPPEIVWRTWLTAPGLRSLRLIYPQSARVGRSETRAFARALALCDVTRLRQFTFQVDDSSDEFGAELIRILSRPERKERQMLRLDIDVFCPLRDVRPLVQAGYPHLTNLRLSTEWDDQLLMLIHEHLPNLTRLSLGNDGFAGWPSAATLIKLLRRSTTPPWQRLYLEHADGVDMTIWWKEGKWNLITSSAARANWHCPVDTLAALITGLGQPWKDIFISVADPEAMITALGRAPNKWQSTTLDLSTEHNHWPSDEKQPWLSSTVRETTMRLLEQKNVEQWQVDDHLNKRHWLMNSEMLNVNNLRAHSVLPWLELAGEALKELVVRDPKNTWRSGDASGLVQLLNKRKDALKKLAFSTRLDDTHWAEDMVDENSSVASVDMSMNEQPDKWLEIQHGELERLDLTMFSFSSIQDAMTKHLVRYNKLDALQLHSKSRWRTNNDDATQLPQWPNLTILILSMVRVENVGVRDIQEIVKQFPRLRNLQFRINDPFGMQRFDRPWLELMAPLQDLEFLVVPYFSGVTVETILAFRKQFPNLHTLGFRCHRPRTLLQTERFASPLDVKSLRATWPEGGRVFVTGEFAGEVGQSFFNEEKRLSTRLVQVDQAREDKMWPSSWPQPRAWRGQDEPQTVAIKFNDWIHYLRQQPWAHLNHASHPREVTTATRFWVVDRRSSVASTWPVLIDTTTWAVEILNPRSGLDSEGIFAEIASSLRKPAGAPNTHLVPGWPNTWFSKAGDATPERPFCYPWSKQRNGNGMLMSALYVLLRVMHPNVPPERIGQALHCGQRVACYDTFAKLFDAKSWHPWTPTAPAAAGDSKADVKMEAVASSGDRVMALMALPPTRDYDGLRLESLDTHRWRLHLTSGQIIGLERRDDCVFVRGWQPDAQLRAVVLAALRAWLQCSWLQMEVVA